MSIQALFMHCKQVLLGVCQQPSVCTLGVCWQLSVYTHRKQISTRLLHKCYIDFIVNIRDKHVTNSIQVLVKITQL